MQPQGRSTAATGQQWPQVQQQHQQQAGVDQKRQQPPQQQMKVLQRDAPGNGITGVGQAVAQPVQLGGSQNASGELLSHFRCV